MTGRFCCFILVILLTRVIRNVNHESWMETLRVNKASDWLHKRKAHIQLLLNCRSKLIVLEWVLSSQLRFHDSAVKRALRGTQQKRGHRGQKCLDERVSASENHPVCLNYTLSYLLIYQRSWLCDLFLPPFPTHRHVHISNPVQSNPNLLAVSG